MQFGRDVAGFAVAVGIIDLPLCNKTIWPYSSLQGCGVLIFKSQLIIFVNCRQYNEYIDDNSMKLLTIIVACNVNNLLRGDRSTIVY